MKARRCDSHHPGQRSFKMSIKGAHFSTHLPKESRQFLLNIIHSCLRDASISEPWGMKKVNPRGDRISVNPEYLFVAQKKIKCSYQGSGSTYLATMMSMHCRALQSVDVDSDPMDTQQRGIVGSWRLLSSGTNPNPSLIDFTIAIDYNLFE